MASSNKSRCRTSSSPTVRGRFRSTPRNALVAAAIWHANLFFDRRLESTEQSRRLRPHRGAIPLALLLARMLAAHPGKAPTTRIAKGRAQDLAVGAGDKKRIADQPHPERQQCPEQLWRLQ